MDNTIKTDYPIFKNREKMNHTIANFWNKVSEGWLKIWGPHIHHGYYENTLESSPLEAQERLIDKLATELEIQPNSKILDVGCGMGGSSCYLAEHYDATVSGISISTKQIVMAKEFAAKQKLKKVSFSIEDALSLNSFAHDSFDYIWSLESCEQFVDKRLFLERAFTKLAPGGKLMLATWCSSQEEFTNIQAKQYRRLCRAFDLPYMPTKNHYEHLFYQQGFNLIKKLDWTDNVKPSWEIGDKLVTAHSFLNLIRMGGLRGLRFAKQLKLMRAAFKEGRVEYGVFVAVKP
jgi:tocopherol O-methyltransferase